MLQSPSAGDDFKGCLRFRLMPAHNVPLAKDDTVALTTPIRSVKEMTPGLGDLVSTFLE
jgi:hypothetical protein